MSWYKKVNKFSLTVEDNIEKEAGVFDKIRYPLMVGLMGTGLGLGNPSESEATQPTPIVQEQAPPPSADTKINPAPVKKDTTQQQFVTVPGANKSIQLHSDAAAAYNSMLAAARAAGIKAPLLLPTSGYRSKEQQEGLWSAALKKYKSEQAARKWVAPPGRSKHQTGKAIDFNLGGRNNSGNVKQLVNLPAYKWLVKNAPKYGFAPYSAEPWHWEYKK